MMALRLRRSGASASNSAAQVYITVSLRSFEALLSVLSKPYDDQPAFARYAAPPRPEQIVRQTFCGT